MTASRLDAPQEAPFTVTYDADEWLPSTFDRIGDATGLTRLDLITLAGLRSLPARERLHLAVGMENDVAANIAATFGWTPQQAHWLTMRRFERTRLRFRDRQHIARLALWARGSGTRFCRTCLDERPGRFLTEWRLSTAYLCRRHLLLLQDGCSTCGASAAEPHVDHDQQALRTRCTHQTAGTADVCGALFSAGWVESVPEDSIIVRCYDTMTREFNTTRSDHLMRTVRSNGMALLGARRFDIIADLAGVAPEVVRGLFEDKHHAAVGNLRTQHPGTVPPSDAHAMAVLTTAAFRLAAEPEEQVRATMRAITFSNPPGYVRANPDDENAGPGGVRHLLNTWPEATSEMEGRVLRAIDRDLRTSERLIWGSAARATIRNASDTAAAITFLQASHEPPPRWDPHHGRRLRSQTPPQRSWSIPSHAWLNWVAPFDLSGRTDAHAFRAAMSAALNLAATADHPARSPKRAIGRILRPSMLGSDAQTTALLAAITELALYLDAHPAPIRYDRRATLPFAALLPAQHWLAIAESASYDPGRQRRWRHAQRFAAERISGGHHPTASADVRAKPRDHEATYNAFRLTVTRELRSAIDGYLRHYLNAVGVYEPVVWQPPRWGASAGGTGPELDDIDLDLLHEVVQSRNFTLAVAADVLRRTPRHVAYAVIAHPPSSGLPVTDVDWSGAFTEHPFKGPASASFVSSAEPPTPDASTPLGS